MKRAICALLAAVLAVTCPGPGAYQALAAVYRGREGAPKPVALGDARPAPAAPADGALAPLKPVLEGLAPLLPIAADIPSPAEPAPEAKRPSLDALSQEVAGQAQRPEPASAGAASHEAGQSFQRAAGLGALAGQGDLPSAGQGYAATAASLGLREPAQWISLPRLVAFLVASEREDRVALISAIKAGRSPEPLLAAKPGRVDYWAGLINDFVQSQFSDTSRPVVEVMANAVDAVQGMDLQRVDASVSDADGAALVLDPGKGMSALDVMEKLLIPLISGKEQQDTIGRFGVGFYSVLQYLQVSGNPMLLRTADGRESLSIHFRKGANGIEAGFQALDPAVVPRGTAIVMPTELDFPELYGTLRDSLQFNRKAEIYVQGRRINTMEGFISIPGEPRQALNGEAVDLFVKPEDSDGKVYLTVNGVTIFALEMKGTDVPGVLVVDFPTQTQLIVSRNKLLVDDFALAAAKAAVDSAARQPNPYPLLNALFPLIQALQSNNPSPRNADNIELYLKRALQGLAAKETRPLLPDNEDFHQIDLPDAIFLHPSLFESMEEYTLPFPAYEDYRPSWLGRQYVMRLAPFKSPAKVLVAYRDTLLLNAAHAPRNVLGKAALQALLELRGFAGRLKAPRTWAGRALAIVTFLGWFALSLLPFTAFRAYHLVKDLATGNRPRDLRKESSYVKAYSFSEIKESVERQRTWQKTVFEIVWNVVTDGLIGWGLFLVLTVIFRLVHPYEALKFACLIAYLFLMTIIMGANSAISSNLIFFSLERYDPPYAAAATALGAFGLAMLPWSLWFGSFSIPFLPWLGLPAVELSSAVATATAMTGVTFPLPALFLAAAAGAGLWTLWGLRRLLRDAAVFVAALLVGFLAASTAVWRWRRVPSALRRELRSQLRWYNPKTWLAAALGTLYWTSVEGRERLLQSEPERAAREAARHLAHHDTSFFELAHALPVLAANPGQLFGVIENYDPAFLRAYVNLAGTLVRRFPSLMLRPGTAQRYAEIWRQNLLMKDRDSIGEIITVLGLFGEDRSQDIPRLIRPYLIYLFGQSAVLENPESPAPEAGATSFKLSQLVALHLAGEIEADDLETLAAALAGQKTSPLRMKVAERALANSANFQSSNPHIFVRELLQNVIDGASEKKLPASRRRFEIAPSLRDGRLNVRFSDRIGMDFNVVTRYLLVPNASSKKDSPDAVGRFGHGFFSILKAAEEVRIRTSTGDGKTLYATLVPVRKNDLVVDVDVTLNVVAESFQGTDVDWRRRTPSPELEVANIKSQVITFGGLVDPKEVAVLWEGRLQNKPKALLASAPTVLGSVQIFRFLGENTLTQRGLFIKDLDDDLLKFIPTKVRELLIKRGVVIQIPASVELIRDRSDLARKQEVLSVLGNGVARAALKAVSDLYVAGDVELSEIFPYDFVQFGNQYAEAVPAEITADAVRVARGELLEDVSRYFDLTNLAMLLGSLPSFRMRWTLQARHWSILEAFRALKSKELHWLHLPDRIARWMLHKSVYKVLLMMALKGLGYSLFVILAAMLVISAGRYVFSADPTLPQVRAMDLHQYSSWWDAFLNFGLRVRHNPEAELFNPFTKALSMMIATAREVSGSWWGVGAVVLSPLALLFGYFVVWLNKLIHAPASVVPVRIERDLDAHWAFSEWAQAAANAMTRGLKDYSGKEIRAAFYMTLYGPAAQAPQGGRWIAFNLRESLWGGPVRIFRGLMRGVGEGRVLDPATRLIRQIAHELVHLREGTGEWTHDQRHRGRMAEVLEAALGAQDELEAARARTAERYEGRLAGPSAMSMALQGYRMNQVLAQEDDQWTAYEFKNLLLTTDAFSRGLSRDGFVEVGRLRRDARGGFREELPHPLLAAAAEALRLAAKAGVPVALQELRVIRAPTPGAVRDLKDHEGQARLLVSQEGTLFVEESLLGSRPVEEFSRLLVLHGLQEAAPDSLRLDAWSESDRLQLHTAEGQAAVARNLSKLRMGRLAVLLRRAQSAALWTAFVFAMLYGYSLFGATTALLASGAIPLLPTPNLITLAALLLPALWFPARKVLLTWRRRAEAARPKAAAPAEDGKPARGGLEGDEHLDPAMKGFLGFLTHHLPIPLVFAVFVIGGFLEEYLFRYVLFHVMGSYFAAALGWAPLAALAVAALLSAAAFAVAHFNNFRGLRMKDMGYLFLYFSGMALLFTLAYWLGGIWVATLIHALFNTSLIADAKRRLAGEPQPEAPASASDEASSEAAGAPTPLPPPAPGERLIFLDGEGQALSLVLDRAKTWPRRKRRAWLQELAKVSFFQIDGRPVSTGNYEAAVALARSLRYRVFGLSWNGFAKRLAAFIAGLPPEMQGPALSHVLRTEKISLADVTASLPQEVEAYRRRLQKELDRRLSAASVELRIIDEDPLIYADKDWIRPLLVEKDGRRLLYLQERFFYQLAHAEREVADLQAERLASSLEGALALAAADAAKPGAEDLGIHFATQLGSEYERRVEGVQKSALDLMERRRFWLHELGSKAWWAVLFAAYIASPIAVLAYRSFSEPGFMASFLAARLVLLQGALTNPWFMGTLAAAFAFDAATKLWVNALLPQYPHMQRYKLKRRFFEFGVGPWRWRPYVANVLHYVKGPRLWFTALTPLSMLLGGVDVTANPVFMGLLIGGALGNVGEVLLRHGATDWIPIERAEKGKEAFPYRVSIANAADVFILLGIIGPWLWTYPPLPLGVLAGYLSHRLTQWLWDSPKPKPEPLPAAAVAKE